MGYAEFADWVWGYPPDTCDDTHPEEDEGGEELPAIDPVTAHGEFRAWVEAEFGVQVPADWTVSVDPEFDAWLGAMVDAHGIGDQDVDPGDSPSSAPRSESVYAAAWTGTAQEFTTAFDPDQDDADDLLFEVLTNPVPAERVAMANFLLDLGADASHRIAPNAVLNVLCSAREHDFELEAPLMQRLLDGGADVNNRDHYGEVPISELLNHGTALDEEMVPFYRILLNSPALDLSLPVSPWKPDGATVRDSIFASRAHIRARLRAMVEERGL